MKYKVGDHIQVAAGKDKGKTGEISKVLPKKGRVVVKGINTYKRHVKAREGVEGGVLSLERPMDVSKLRILDPSTNKPTRIGYKIEGNTKVRISKASGKELGKTANKVKEKSKK